ncbi:MAG: hypothetical protein C0520_17055 [Sphingopyxis sp.]|nr:hypothetical protein [Sphingopyxis sp.]
MTDNYGETIAKALATQGGHLFIGRGGFSLHYETGWLSGGYDCEPVKAAPIAAGLPGIDSRKVNVGKVADLALRGPMIAVGKPPDPPPWRALSYAPLAAGAEAYARAGADVLNMPGCGGEDSAARE